MIMKRNILLIISIMMVSMSCEKIWEADLREKALDTIRGYYEIESGVWNGNEPIDLDGDGIASFDYYKEWLGIPVGVGDHGSSLSNGGGSINIPYSMDSNADWGGPVNISRRVERVNMVTEVIIDGKEARLEFSFPDNPDVEFEHTGYGEFTVSRTVTCTVANGEGASRQITGPVTFKFKRTRYKTE